MGTHSYSEECPKCQSNMNCWNETRSFNVGGECLECGFSYYTKTEVMSLEEVNEQREGFDLKPLKVLKKQNGK